MASDEDPITAWLKSFGPMRPYAVTIRDVRQILGGKARSQIYQAIGRGELDAVKDGSKTLIVVASIVRYCGRMRPAQVKVQLTKETFHNPKVAAKRSSNTGDLLNDSEPASAVITRKPKIGIGSPGARLDGICLGKNVTANKARNNKAVS